jgi:myo-inositol-1(or 4)-monophosphatase
MQPTLSYIETLAQRAGVILRDGYSKEHQIKFKGLIDLVTEIDHESEAFLLGEVQRDFPGHHIFSEESGVIHGNDEHIWYIDPLDGTVNYAHQIPIFSVSIAYAFKGVLTLGAVYDPMRDEMFLAERGKGSSLNGKPIHVSSTTDLQKSLLVTGFPYDAWNTEHDNFANFVRFGKMTQGVRRLGSAAIYLCYVASGRFDGFWELALKPWDVAAGGLICDEAGASITNVTGEADYITPPQSVVAATPKVHERMLRELKTPSL